MLRMLTSQPELKKNTTGTPPLTRFFGPKENRVKGKPRYRRSDLVVKSKNGEFFFQSPLFHPFFRVFFCSIQISRLIFNTLIALLDAVTYILNS